MGRGAKEGEGWMAGDREGDGGMSLGCLGTGGGGEGGGEWKVGIGEQGPLDGE